jgi:hypothetical protein
MLYSADGLTQVRRALGIPRPHPLSVPAQAVYRVAHQLEISGLEAAAREETTRALGGLASALNYEKLRTGGWSSAVGGLPVVREYHPRNAINRKVYVSEPKERARHPCPRSSRPERRLGGHRGGHGPFSARGGAQGLHLAAALRCRWWSNPFWRRAPRGLPTCAR